MSVSLAGRSLRLSEGVPGGLSFRELVKRGSTEPRRLLEIGAEETASEWSSAVGKDWGSVTSYVQRVTGDAAAGSGFLRIGDGEQAGSGMAAERRLALIPGHVCRVTWQARTPDPSMSYIVCLRLFDRKGTDVTATTSAPSADGGGAWRHSPFSNYEFMAWLRQYLEERGKLLMLNLFPPATRLYGHLGDVVGCELAGNQEDSHALNQRIYARRRPVSNLLQWKFSVLKRVPAMTREQMTSYIDNQLFYGFWPGISTAGGDEERPAFARELLPKAP